MDNQTTRFFLRWLLLLVVEFIICLISVGHSERLEKIMRDYFHIFKLCCFVLRLALGDVVLKDLKLKAEALNALKLPVTVKAGFVGTITLKVPWKSLGKEPVIVLIDRVFVLAHPASDVRTMKEEDREKLFEAKIQQIEEAESATLDAISKSKTGSV
ncbi:putative vacuolar protein sorting-associated protein 13F [Senna tora]|uniref:Putative vacuolar protein sorting-associated protein 13F n=1 Tax=Senna tora TaxID=362788 RepID=A0A834X4E4_9FABA|nr:putative vacuolar protein sorting-associated protein 13F [Senna tora]